MKIFIFSCKKGQDMKDRFQRYSVSVNATQIMKSAMAYKLLVIIG